MTTMPDSVTCHPRARGRGEIVADGRLPERAHFVEDRAADLAWRPDVAVVQDHAAFDQSAGVDAYSASQNGIAHRPPERMHPPETMVSMASPRRFLVEGEIGGRIGIAGGAHGPLAIVEIQGGLDERRSMLAS